MTFVLRDGLRFHAEIQRKGLLDERTICSQSRACLVTARCPLSLLSSPRREPHLQIFQYYVVHGLTSNTCYSVSYLTVLLSLCPVTLLCDIHSSFTMSRSFSTNMPCTSIILPFFFFYLIESRKPHTLQRLEHNFSKIHSCMHSAGSFRLIIHLQPLSLHNTYQVFDLPQDLLLVDTLLHQAHHLCVKAFFTGFQICSNSALQQTSFPACLLLSPDDKLLLG